MAKFRFECPKCSKEFKREGGLAWHLEHIHGDSKKMKKIADERESAAGWLFLANTRKLLTDDQELQAIRLLQSSDLATLEALAKFLRRKVTGTS